MKENHTCDERCNIARACAQDTSALRHCRICSINSGHAEQLPALVSWYLDRPWPHAPRSSAFSCDPAVAFIYTALLLSNLLLWLTRINTLEGADGRCKTSWHWRTSMTTEKLESVTYRRCLTGSSGLAVTGLRYPCNAMLKYPGVCENMSSSSAWVFGLSGLLNSRRNDFRAVQLDNALCVQ